jgi:hypothetical protein
VLLIKGDGIVCDPGGGCCVLVSLDPPDPVKLMPMISRPDSAAGMPWI